MHSAAPVSTILDERAYLRGAYSAYDAARWRQEIAKRPALAQEARLRILLGEYEIGTSEPARGQEQFRRALTILPASSPDRGLASYDLALTLFFEGRFPEARHEFRALLQSPLRGFDRKNAALYAKHASACASYHAAHVALGIPQPDRLDPLCGAASLASAMRALGMRHDRARVLTSVKHNGEGSSLQDLVDALPRFGLSGKVVTADQKGLIASPVPLVAFVERDHFVTVVSADQKGIEYVCSDCGAWPGGPIRLTWKQWKAMDASIFLAVSRMGSPQAIALAHLPTKLGGKASRIGLAERGNGSLAAVAAAQRTLTMVAGHVAVLQSGNPYGHTLPPNGTCGMRGTSLHCAFENCPKFCLECSPSSSFAGDPVNLATGEEEYRPDADLAIYNPKGPSISWSRSYNSLANTTPSGLGSGWSHSYNFRIVRKLSGSAWKTELVMPNAARVTVNDAGAAAPTSTSPVTPLSFGPGVPMKVEWRYASSTAKSYVLTFKDQTKWTFSETTSNGTLLYYPTGIQDRFGNVLFLNWGPHTMSQPDPELTTISGGTPTLVYSTLLLEGFSNADGPLAKINYLATGGRIDYIAEYPATTSTTARAVRYEVAALPNSGVSAPWPTSLDELTRVSLIKPVTRDAAGNLTVGTFASSPGRYTYGYSNASNLEGAETVPYLTTIGVPSVSAAAVSATTGLWDGTSLSTTTLTYGSDGSVTKLTDAEGNFTTFTPVLDANGNAIRTSVVTKDAQFNVSKSYSATWDSHMNTVKNSYAVSGFVAPVYSYNDPNDPYGPSSVTDGNNRTWQMTWDAYGNLTSSTTPKGVTRSWTYSPTFFGQVIDDLIPGLRETNPHYDATSGAVTSIDETAPYRAGLAPGAQQTTTYGAYTALGNPTNVTEPGNSTTSFRTTAFGYGGDGFAPRLGLPTYATDAAGKSAYMSYDVRGNLIETIDRDGNITDHYYNLANQVTRTVLPASGEHGTSRPAVEYTYAYLGGPVTFVKQYSEVSPTTVAAQNQTIYGPEGEVAISVGTGEYKKLFYDGSYRVRSVQTGTPGNYNSTTGTRYTYDAAGRVTQVTGSNASTNYAFDTYHYAYDPAGNLKQAADGKGNHKTYAYDDLDGLLSGITYTKGGDSSINYTYPAATGANGENYDAVFSYDGYDRLSYSYGGANGGYVLYTYDGLDNVKKETRNYTTSVTFDYQYNPDGSTSQMLASGTGTNVGYWLCSWTYTYDALGRFASLASPLGTSSATYSPGGRTLTRTLPNAAATTYDYYPGNGTGSRSALRGLYNYAPTAALWSSYGTTYTPQGTLGGLSNSNPAAPAFAGSTTFSYSNPVSNNALTLVGESSTRNSGLQNYTHSYDTGLNPLTLRGVAQATGTTPYTPNDLPTAVASTDYDGAGNYKGNATVGVYGHDAENRMIAAPHSGWAAGYRPDDGLRAWKTVNGARSYTYYDQDGVPVVELNAAGDPSAFMASDAEGLVGRASTSGALYLYQFDPQGNVAHTSDGSGALRDSRMYDAYGKEWSNVAISQADRYGFNAQSGYIADRELGTSGMPLYYCENREYDPAKGRWLEKDPIGFAGGMNAYSYCAAQPVGNADPSGLAPTFVFPNPFIGRGSGGGNGGRLLGGALAAGIAGAMGGAAAFGAGVGGSGAPLSEKAIQQIKFRRDLIKKSGGHVPPNGEAHHILPQGDAFKAFLERTYGDAALDCINDGSANGMWWSRGAHQRGAWAYEQRLREWIDTHPEGTLEDAMRFGKWLSRAMIRGKVAP